MNWEVQRIMVTEHEAKLIEVGRRIREAREAAGMSLADVERSGGGFKASVSRIENGVRNGRPCSAMVTTLYRIAKSIGRHPAEFFATLRDTPRMQGEERLASLVSRNIARYREASGMTRGALGALIESSQDVIARTENPDHSRAIIPTTLALIRIADGLSVDVVEFFLPESGYRYRDPV